MRPIIEAVLKRRAVGGAKKRDGLLGRLFVVLRLRNRDEFYDLPRAGVDKHYGVIAPEEVFYRATTFDHDDVRRQIVKHDCRRQGHSDRYRNFSFAHRFHVRSVLAEVGLDFIGVDLRFFTAFSRRARLGIRGSSSLTFGLSLTLPSVARGDTLRTCEIPPPPL